MVFFDCFTIDLSAFALPKSGGRRQPLKKGGGVFGLNFEEKEREKKNNTNSRGVCKRQGVIRLATSLPPSAPIFSLQVVECRETIG
jgi:hypothetical protein